MPRIRVSSWYPACRVETVRWWVILTTDVGGSWEAALISNHGGSPWLKQSNC